MTNKPDYLQNYQGLKNFYELPANTMDVPLLFNPQLPGSMGGVGLGRYASGAKAHAAGHLSGLWAPNGETIHIMMCPATRQKPSKVQCIRESVYEVVSFYIHACDPHWTTTADMSPLLFYKPAATMVTWIDSGGFLQHTFIGQGQTDFCSLINGSQPQIDPRVIRQGVVLKLPMASFTLPISYFYVDHIAPSMSTLRLFQDKFTEKITTGSCKESVLKNGMHLWGRHQISIGRFEHKVFEGLLDSIEKGCQLSPRVLSVVTFEVDILGGQVHVSRSLVFSDIVECIHYIRSGFQDPGFVPPKACTDAVRILTETREIIEVQTCQSLGLRHYSLKTHEISARVAPWDPDQNHSHPYQPESDFQANVVPKSQLETIDV